MSYMTEKATDQVNEQVRVHHWVLVTAPEANGYCVLCHRHFPLKDLVLDITNMILQHRVMGVNVYFREFLLCPTCNRRLRCNTIE